MNKEVKLNHYVYIITNNINGRRYIGKRSCKCNIEDDTYMGSGFVLKNSRKKYGIENFAKEIVKVFETEQEALDYEKELITKYDACKSKDFYNIASGGLGGNVHAGYTEEQKKEFSKKMLAIMNTEEMKRKISESGKGRKHTEEAKKKISAATKGEKHPMWGKTHTEEVRKRLSEAHKGKKLSEEHKMKLIISNTGRECSEETKLKIGAANKGKIHTEDAKKRMSKNRKGKYTGENAYWYGKSHSDETKKRISAANKGYCHTEDAKKRMSENRSGGKHPAAKKVKIYYNNIFIGEFGCIKYGAEFILEQYADKGFNFNGLNKNLGKLANGEKVTLISKYYGFRVEAL